MKSRAIVFSFLSTVTLELHAESLDTPILQTYRIERFSRDIASCEAQANAIASKFEAITSQKVVEQGCLPGAVIGYFDIIINYESTTLDNLVSTYRNLALGAQQGSFDTRGSCESNLQNEIELFTEKTGLTPVAALCFEETSPWLSSHPIAIRIDGFGTPRLVPLTMNATFYEEPLLSPLETTQLFERSLSQLTQLESPRVSLFRSSSGLPAVSVRYYSRQGMPFQVERLSSFENDAACLKDKARLAGIISDLGISGAEVLCGKERFTDITTMYRIGLLTKMFRSELIPTLAKDRASCEASLPSVIQRNQARAKTVDGFCSFERPSTFQPPVFIVRLVLQD